LKKQIIKWANECLTFIVHRFPKLSDVKATTQA
jgi:hypothetical protein